MLSVIETCRQQNHSVIDLVTKAVQANFKGNPTPELLFDV